MEVTITKADVVLNKMFKKMVVTVFLVSNFSENIKHPINIDAI